VHMHLKTLHLAARLQLGSVIWSVSDVLRNQRKALVEAVRAVRSGLSLHVHLHALVRAGDGPRYIHVAKACHLVHFALGAYDTKPESQAWPARTTQLFDSIFLTQGHVQFCLEAESTTTDPLLGWRAKKWANSLTERTRDAHRAGRPLAACYALLLRSFLLSRSDAEEMALIPSVGRMLCSKAAVFAQLQQLGCTLQGVLECSGVEEHKLKVDNKGLVACFDKYRVPILEMLTTDGAYNFESLRATVQGAFADVILDIRQQGVVTADGFNVLEAVNDYISLVEISIAAHVVRCTPTLRAALRSCADGEGSG